MPECATTHLQRCKSSNFFQGRTPGLPAFRGGPLLPPGRGGKGQEGALKGREGERRGREEGRGDVDPWPPAPKCIIRHCRLYRPCVLSTPATMLI